MSEISYKKMAGTAAVFVCTDFARASPVERDGMTWSWEELHLDELSSDRAVKPAMATVLALEGLEEYDPPQSGDIRTVESLAADFIYCNKLQGWVQLKVETDL